MKNTNATAIAIGALLAILFGAILFTASTIAGQPDAPMAGMVGLIGGGFGGYGLARLMGVLAE